jgi:DNA polymerase delta subunit 3
VKAFTNGTDSELASECKTKSGNGISNSGITLKEKSNDPLTEGDKKDNATEAASTTPKRRKVLKTRIDERGREGNTVA